MTPSVTLKVMQLTLHSCFYIVVLECKANQIAPAPSTLNRSEGSSNLSGFQLPGSFLEINISFHLYLMNNSEITRLSWMNKYYTMSFLFFFRFMDSKCPGTETISFSFSRLIRHTISALRNSG